MHLYCLLCFSASLLHIWPLL